MHVKRPTLEDVLFLSALLLGGLVRFAALGSAPLDDSEARLGLLAWQLAQGGETVLPGQPAYLLLTRGLFELFGPTNFLARFWPALAGCGLAGVAWFLRDQLGRKRSLLLAFFLALDPILVGTSRYAGSQMLAITCLVWMLAAGWRGKSALVGAFAGLGLLCGATFWTGIIAFGVVLWLLRAEIVILWREVLNPKTILIWGAASFLFLGTAFLTEPRGLSAAASGLVEYFRGWVVPGGISVSRLMGAFFAYDLPALLFGGIGLVQALREGHRSWRMMGLWGAGLLVLILAWPTRSVFDAAWLVVPLLAFGAYALAAPFLLEKDEHLPALGQAAITAGLGFYIIYSFLRVPLQTVTGSPVAAEYALRMMIALVIIFAISALVAWGWSLRPVWSGFRRAGVLFLGILWFSALFHVMGVSRHPWAELLREAPRVQDADLVTKIMGQIQQWRPDPHTPLQVAVLDMDRPSMRWLLRGYSQVLFTSILEANSHPEIILTPADVSVEVGSAYRGQELTWTLTPAWSLVAPNEWLHWLFFRDVAVEGQEASRIILWVRADAFPGGLSGTAPAESQPSQGSSQN